MEMAISSDDWEHHVVNPLLQDMHCGDDEYFNAQDLLGQAAATAPTASVSAQSPLSETNPPSLSPNGVTQTGALSPGALSQTSQNAGTTSLNNGAVANNATPATACCENGRPVLTDPVSGQTVCSCQYDSARLALSGYRSAGVYGTPYPSTDQNPYPSIGVDSSAFYSPLSNPYGLKDSGPTSDMSWTAASLQPTTGYYSPYDPTLAAYGYGAGYDLAARRKNATRESTATLKAWLNEHKKNPYPTKGEKIMLAIITKMTLTQVSTWFANARRRLKKENKMTWEPKNKTDDDDDAMVSDDDKDKDELDEKTRDHHKDMHHVKSEHGKDEDDDLDDDRKPDLGHHGHHPYYQHSMSMGGHYNSHHHLKSEIESKNQTGSDCGVPIPASKPKIWSLADTAACKTPPLHLHPNAGQWAYQQATAHQHPSHQYNNHLTSNQQQQSVMHHQQQPNGTHQHPQQLHQQSLHHQQQQQHHMAMSMGENGASIDSTTPAAVIMDMNGHHSQAMSGMMTTFGGNSAYTRYAGFLTTPTTSATHPIHQQQQQLQHQQAQHQQHHQQHPYINHNHTEGASITSVTPNSTGQPTTPTLQQQNSNQTSNNQTMGFPEVQTDTPPQTPPNMKFNTTNTTTADTINNGNINNNTYIGNFRVQHNDNSTSPNQQMMSQMTDGFKPFYKNNQQLGNYVSPV